MYTNQKLINHTLCFALVFGFLGCGGSSGSLSATGSRTDLPSDGGLASTDEVFVLGAWVNADPYAWGDISGMGNNSIDTIEAIAADMEDMGLNTVWIAGLSSGFDGENVYGSYGLIEVWLEAAERHGLKVVIEGSGLPYAIPKDSPDIATITRNTVIPTWQDIAYEFGSHPALLAYCPVEEIGDNVPAETPTLNALDEVGDAVAAIDPDHPVVTIHISTWYEVAEAELRIRGRNMRAEVADFYPFTEINDWTDFSAGTSFATPDEATDAIINTVDEHVALADSADIPMWLFAQSGSSTWYRRMNGLGSAAESRPLFRMPTAAEMSIQIWGPIVTGARGVIFFPYNSSAPYSNTSLATLTEWELGTGLRTLTGQATTSHQGLEEAGSRLNSQLPLLGRLRADSNLLESGYLLGRAFQDSNTDLSYMIIVNRDVLASGHASTAVLPTSVGVSARLTDVFTGQAYTSSTISSLTLSAGSGTILRID